MTDVDIRQLFAIDAQGGQPSFQTALGMALAAVR